MTGAVKKDAGMSMNYCQRFIKELEIESLLCQANPRNAAEYAATSVTPEAARAFSGKVQVGEIRLLPQTERLQYVAVVGAVGEESFLVVPFSHNTVPADSREMLSANIGGVGLRVYQLWNRITAEASLLEKTWNIGSVSADDLRRLREFITALNSDTPLSEELLELTSIPINTGDDIRRGYFVREKKVLAPFTRENFLARCRREEKQLFRELTEQLEFPQAATLAAGEARKDICRELKVDGFPATVDIEYSWTEKTIRFTAYADADGDALTDRFDDWRLMDGFGEKLEVITAGRCTVRGQLSFDGRCCLQAPDGTIYPMTVTD